MTQVASDPRIFLGEVACLVVLSSLFDSWERWARRQIKESKEETGRVILDALFKEITGLGFIGLLLFLATRSGVGGSLSGLLLGAPAEGEGNNLLSETFENVHIMIFMLMVVLLFQGAAAFAITRQVSNDWGEYAQTRTFGTSEYTLETKVVEAGYLKRVPNPNAPRGVDLELVQPFGYGDSLLERQRLREDPLHKLLMWRAIRHEFLFPMKVFSRGEEAVTAVPERGLFSFENYLRRRLGKTVVALVDPDFGTWFAALVLLVPIVYACRSFPPVLVTALQCGCAWLLAAFAVLLTIVLEEDTYELTPQVPADLRMALRLFSGTSSPMLRRVAQLAPGTVRSAYTGSQTEGEAKSKSLMGRRFRPGLGDAEGRGRPRLARPPEFDARRRSPGRFPSSESYRQIVCSLVFFQAICVTSLVVSYLSVPLDGWVDVVLYALSWAEWPVFLFLIAPVLVRRVTVRNSIEDEKDEPLIRKVSLQSKEDLLRDFVRLVQIAGLERRAEDRGEAWTHEVPESWASAEAEATFNRGLTKWYNLPMTEKAEVWNMFAVLDVDNDGVFDIDGLGDILRVTGCCRSPMVAAKNLLRLVDAHDGHGKKVMSWREFKVMVTLATQNREPEEVREDLLVFFNVLDEDNDGEVTVFDLSRGFKEMRIGMSSNDAANLLYTYFGRAMPTITSTDFVDWVQAASQLRGR